MDFVEMVNCLLLNSFDFVSSSILKIFFVLILSILLFLRLYLRLTLSICHCTATMVGKTVIITGGNSTIGKEATRELAKRGARIILGCRNAKSAQQIAVDIMESTGNHNVVFKQLDLASFRSVREFAKTILEIEERLDVLINNAGIIGPSKRAITEDGCEVTMQTNYFGHFLLTNLLLDRLKEKGPSRIINVASHTHRFGNKRWTDINSNCKHSMLQAYADSKLGNIYFTRELAKRLEGTGVTVNCLCPGIVKTELAKGFGIQHHIYRIINYLYGMTPLEGAQTALHLAISKDLEKVTGKYFRNCKEDKLSSIATDEVSSRKLWSLSESIVGL